jgi:hypothetical protein
VNAILADAAMFLSCWVRVGRWLSGFSSLGTAPTSVAGALPSGDFESGPLVSLSRSACLHVW